MPGTGSELHRCSTRRAEFVRIGLGESRKRSSASGPLTTTRKDRAMAAQDVTADELRARFSYDPETGLFTSRKTGAVVGRRFEYGYIMICIRRRAVRAHRMAWLYVTGSMPKGEIDHIDGTRDNNRFANLRDVPNIVNQQNIVRAMRTSTSRVLGAFYDKQTGRYRSTIRINGRNKHLGRFATAEEAHAAYVAAKRAHHAGCTL